MKKQKLINLFFLLIIVTQSSWAQEEKPEFIINAELRTRSNILHGYKTLPTQENIAHFLVEQRTRLGFAYKTKQLEMNITVQDSRIWGDENIYTKTGLFGDTASIDLKEAWAKLNFNNLWSLKIGRQALQLDGGRLVAYRNWSNLSLSYDAALIQFHKNNFNLDIALSYNNSLMNLFAAEYNPEKMKSLNYIYLKNKFNKDFMASISSIFSGFQAEGSATTIYFKTSLGTYIKFDNKKLFARGEFYYQLGKNVEGVDVNAYFFSTDIGYYINKIYLGAGIDYMSGQDPNKSRTEEFQAFDILYGTRFGYYGNLNYVVTPASTLYGGLVDPFLKLNVNINQKNSIKTTFHIFQTAQKIPNPNIQGSFYDKSLGSELDMIYTYKFAKDISIRAGYHLAFPTETMEILKGVEPGNSQTPQWFWLAFNFKPTLFSNK